MAVDQFVGRNGQDTLKFVVSNDVASSSKGKSKVLPNTLTNFSLPFRCVVGVLKVIISREGMGEDGVPKSDRGVGVSSFPSSSLRFFDPGVI